MRPAEDHAHEQERDLPQLLENRGKTKTQQPDQLLPFSLQILKHPFNKVSHCSIKKG